MIEANPLVNSICTDTRSNQMFSYSSLGIGQNPMMQHHSDKQQLDESRAIHSFNDLNAAYPQKLASLECFNWFKGGEQPDRLVREQKGDILLGKRGSDLLVGNAGDDRLLGGRGNDVLQGKAGHDRLVGGAGDDQLDGGTGHDRLVGGAGNDTLADFKGSDRLNGGQGKDLFKVGNANTSNRTIVEDFQVGTDQIRILRPSASFASLQFQQTKVGLAILDRGKEIAFLKGVNRMNLDAGNFLFEIRQPAIALPTEPSPVPEITAQSFQQILNQSRLAPAESVYVSSPSGTFAGASGVQSLTTHDPIQTSDLFEIGSITKNFTSVLMLKLADAGLLSLDDTLGRLAPDIAALIPNGQTISLRDALNGSAGIPTFVPFLVEDLQKNPSRQQSGYTSEELVQFIKGVPRYTGDRLSLAGDWVYPDTGHVIAGIIAERVTGDSYSSELRRRVLEPLGLRDTFSSLERLPLNRVATGYADTNGDHIPDDVSTGVNIGKLSFSDGALLSTARDLGKFVRGIFQSHFLSEASRQEMMTAVNAEEDPGSGVKYGVGTAMVENTPLGNAYFFGGATQGYSATYLFLPDLNIVYAATQNAAPELSESPLTSLEFVKNPILQQVIKFLHPKN